MSEETLDQREKRIEKLRELKERGIDPFPYSFTLTHTASEILAQSDKLQASEARVRLAGRIMSVRRHGKTIFAHLMDRTGRIQIYLRRDGLGEEAYSLFKLFDIGDILGVEGSTFQTKTGETTVDVDGFVLQAKALRPLPETWDGLRDKELRLRRRYLDLIMNPESREVFLNRNKIIRSIRSVLDSKGFIEVETPILQPLYGGAFATPFKTHYKALDIDVYLRIADELYLKRLIVGGLERVYEFGKDFRNEGVDSFHNPEFLQLEAYQAYADYSDIMDLFEEMIGAAVLEVKGGTKLEYQGAEVDFKRPWARLSFFDGINKELGKDIRGMDLEDLAGICSRLGIDVPENARLGKLLDTIFGKVVQPKIVEPTFVVDYPKEISPLAKEKRGDADLVERFEPVICGVEIGNAFSELNNPLEQRLRFEEQQKMRREGSEEAQQLDEDFLMALEYGMPPTGGLGLGVDRLAMLICNTSSIRDVILFPQLRPQGGQ
ncbi:lysine--tRNA ligase [candidate division TA06 bacterium]|uniref:Lysine--tRNA ligase n=1 Tax=candidate division TA06 bacterium TaxID=2250710 RepID=A0A523XH48_UNCT6|nr:MAG: lysine--tRNA ligase [candidate division TA06 bacterium]